MQTVRNIKIAVACGTLILAGLSGCSMFSTSNLPVDCNAVKVQRESGKTDVQIASDLGAEVAKVNACGSGPEAGSNKTTGTAIPQSY